MAISTPQVKIIPEIVFWTLQAGKIKIFKRYKKFHKKCLPIRSRLCIVGCDYEMPRIRNRYYSYYKCVYLSIAIILNLSFI